MTTPPDDSKRYVLLVSTAQDKTEEGNADWIAFVRRVRAALIDEESAIVCPDDQIDWPNSR